MRQIVFQAPRKVGKMQRTTGSLQGRVSPYRRHRGILLRMLTKTKTLLLLAGSMVALTALRQTISPTTASAAGSGPEYTPQYTSDGDLKFPEHYREWIYLTTGFDMSYNPGMSMDHHMFDNVFVEPSAYKAFQETGTWPDKTVLVLEVRGAEGKGSINQRGNYQSTEVIGREVHVKDEARFPGKWAFFGVDDGKTGKMFPVEAECYKCHAAHAAVDTTFVQFYPTLLPIAKSKGTLSAAYGKEVAEKK